MTATGVPRLADFLLLAVLYYLGAKVGVILTTMPEGNAILWPPNGVLLAFVLRFEGRRFFTLAALALAAEVAADLPTFSLGEAVLFGANNIVEVAVAHALLSRWGFDRRFPALPHVAKFVVAAPVAAAFLAACTGAGIYTLFRGGETGYVEYLRIWWFGDALGLMIVTPFLLSVWSRTPAPSRSVPRMADALVGVGALVALALLLTSRDGALSGVHVGPVLLLPFVIYAATRGGFGVAAGAVAVASLAVLVLTTRGLNPFGHVEARDAVIHAQEFIFVMSIMALGLAALLSDLRASQSALTRAGRDLHVRADALERANRDLRGAEAEIRAMNERLDERVRHRTRELEAALAQVSQLQGLLPICAWCKSVRDDEHYWHSVEDYISERTDARFSHAICPDCSAKLMESFKARRA